MSRTRILAAAAASTLALDAGIVAQTEPVNGIRPAEVRTHAITGATVVTAPGQRLEGATIIIRDGVIESVGTQVAIAPEARVWPADGLTVYPGLIDAAVLVEASPLPEPGQAGAHWNAGVHPQVLMSDLPAPPPDVREELRKLGFTVAAVYPSQGVWRGSGAVVALADEDEHVLAYRDRAALAAGFERNGDRSYPVSLMGAIALIRQTLYDAQWYGRCVELYQRDPAGLEPPIRADSLAALQEVLAGEQQVLFEVSDEHDVLRVARIADEFELDAALLGSGYEFRRLDAVVATGLPIIVPLQYPKRPEVAALTEADDVSLRRMMTWEQAPTNARRLIDAGTTMALTTHRMEKRADFAKALHKAIQHGLTEDEALASLTTTPARLLGLDDVLGTIETGKAANLVVVDGPLLVDKPKIRSVWINGRRYEPTAREPVAFEGPATLTTSLGLEVRLDVDTAKPKVTVHAPDGKKIKAGKVTFQHDRLMLALDGQPFGIDGYVRLTGLVIDGTITGTGVLPGGEPFTFTIAPAPAEAAQAAGAPDAEPDEKAKLDEKAEAEEAEADEEFSPAPEELVYPLGAFGLARPPVPRDVLLTNATIWTCGPDGIIEGGAMLIRDGRIAAVGRAGRVSAPPGVEVLDLEGRHLTPGLIDCHSHTGIAGRVNEGTQAVTAEVRIGDVIDPDDINFYRQLAGGLTAANQLHGSANPIGGQNSVVKLRWSGTAADLPIPDAPGGIKFALGENVKRSQDRYPNTRMGVEAIIRDSFTAARDYQARLERYQALPPAERDRTMPPRRDLELDALVEVLEGKRLVHCHSYRQDEILMLIRLAEEFGFTVGTFQHVLEGYKVADAIGAHGAGASTFSDWWAYKIEVMDAIPFNGALMHDVGVLVSFNSDSSELARRLNTEAAKAVRYGGLDPAEALNLVTINPARQLRVDHRVGSLEVGKDADFAVFSESPLSTYARCEQTWIDGACYFDLREDRRMRDWVQAQRQRLIDKILAEELRKPSRGDDREGDGKDKEGGAAPEDAEPEYSCCWSHEHE